MKVRVIHTSESDRRSAALFFTAMCDYWDLSEVEALEMFARNGELTVSRYSTHVHQLDLWEWNPEHREELEKFNPRELKIGDSYVFLQQCMSQYDLIVVDTPQGVHSDSVKVQHVEHFDVVAKLATLMKEECLVVLYVNLRPYDKEVLGEHGYDQYADYSYLTWMDARAKFYKVGNPKDIAVEKALIAYRREFGRQGYAVQDILIMPCYSDVPGYDSYAVRMALNLQKNYSD